MFFISQFFFYFVSRTLETLQKTLVQHMRTRTHARARNMYTHALFMYTQQYYYNVHYNPANRTYEIEGEIVVVVIHPLEGRVIYEPASMKYGRPVAPRVHTHISII